MSFLKRFFAPSESEREPFPKKMEEKYIQSIKTLSHEQLIDRINSYRNTPLDYWDNSDLDRFNLLMGEKVKREVF